MSGEDYRLLQGMQKTISLDIKNGEIHINYPEDLVTRRYVPYLFRYMKRKIRFGYPNGDKNVEREEGGG